jgi:Predicted N6-adenine-specific DNA methylase
MIILGMPIFDLMMELCNFPFILYSMDNNYNTLLITEKGLENITIEEIEKILNRNIDYNMIEKKNKILIYSNLDFEERLKLLFNSRTIDNILYKEKDKYKYFLLKNLYERGYQLKKIEKLKSTLVNKIIYYSDIRENEEILNIMDDGSFSIEQGIYIKNILPIFWRRKEISKYMDYFEKYINIKKKVNIKIYCVNKDKNKLLLIERNSENALVNDIIFFRRLDIEWIDLKFKEESIDKIFTFRIKKNPELNIKDKYIFYHSNKLLKDNGKLYLLLYSYDYKKILDNIINYIKKYSLRYVDSFYLYNYNKRLLLIVLEKI